MVIIDFRRAKLELLGLLLFRFFLRRLLAPLQFLLGLAHPGVQVPSKDLAFFLAD